MSADLAARLERQLEFLKADPENAVLLADCANLALATGKPDEARSLLERALALRPGEAALRYNLAYAHMLAAKYAEAKELLTPLAAEMPQAALLLIRAHHHLGELEPAIELAERHVTAHPEDAEVVGQLAMLYLDAGDLVKARAWADRGIAEKRKIPEAYCSAGFIALGDEDEARARELMDKALELNPQSGRAWTGKGVAALFAGDLAAAESALRRATEHLPDHIGTWQALAWSQILRGELDAAEASFRKAYQIDRTIGETHGGLAIIELLRGQGSRAQRRADTALRLNPHSLAGQYAKLLLEVKDEPGRAAGVRRILGSQRALRAGTLLDVVSRHAARIGAKRPREGR